jgi:hypothetical protein
MNFTELVEALRASIDKAPKPFDTTAEVVRIEDEIAWVQIPGSDDETPVNLTIAAKEGDNVQVRVSGGNAFLVGNATAPPTDDATAIVAQEQAEEAVEKATTATEFAEEASAAAASAQASATLAGQAASAAQTSANAAQVSATNASEYASRALGNLSTVQSVAETLTWITQHGTMTLTTDTSLDPTHVYFVRDTNGDYQVGSYKYSIVAEPDADNLSTYYELSIDESLNNYVGTHLVLTGEGLWLLPAASGTYKILIATGAGSTYTSPGTYIIDNTGGTIAYYGATIQIGENNKTRVEISPHSLALKNGTGSGRVYFKVEDLKDDNGDYSLTEKFKGNGSDTFFPLSFTAKNTSYTVTVSDSSGGTVTKRTTDIQFSTAPTNGATITVNYTTTSNDTVAFTFGSRLYNSFIGAMSFASGVGVTASGTYSHAEGLSTTASGFEGSHAEGSLAVASGLASHAQNRGTIAAGDYQTAIGTYNVEDTSGTYAFIIGNGTADNDRSNAFAVDWNGNVEANNLVTNVAYNAQTKMLMKTINGTSSAVVTMPDFTSVPTFTTPTIYSSRCKSLSGGYYKVGKMVYVQLQGTNNSARTPSGREGRQYMSGFPTPATTDRVVLPVIWDAHQGMMANITSTGALYLCNDDGLSFEADKVFFITGCYFTSD